MLHLEQGESGKYNSSEKEHFKNSKTNRGCYFPRDSKEMSSIWSDRVR
jgi:hypothetical protein